MVVCFTRFNSGGLERVRVMYKSPIEVIYGQVKTQMEGDIFKAVQNYGINVDKDELIKALAYDRNQYDKGYTDGHRDAFDTIVRCKDCKHWLKDVAGCTDFVGRCELANYMVGAAGFCVYGEKIDGKGEP